MLKVLSLMMVLLTLMSGSFDVEAPVESQERAFFPLEEWTYEVGTEAIGFLYRFTVKGCAVWHDASEEKDYLIVTQDVENIGTIGTAATPGLRAYQNGKEIKSIDFNDLVTDPPRFGIIDVDEWIKLTDPADTDGYAFPMTQFGYATIGGFGKSAQLFELQDTEKEVSLELVVGETRYSTVISPAEVLAFMQNN